MSKKLGKRLIACLMTTAVAFTGLSACGNADNAANETQSTEDVILTPDLEEEQDSEKTVVRFTFWGGEDAQQGYAEIADQYMQQHPNVKIELEYQSYDGYKEKIMTQLVSGTAPEIIMVDSPWSADWGATGYFADLEAAGLDLSELDETYITYGQFGGKQVFYPGGQIALSIICNKALTEQFEIDVDKQYTWEEIMEIGTSIHAANPDMYLFDADEGLVNNMVTEMLKGLTGEQIISDSYELGFSQEDLEKCYAWMQEAYANGVIEPLGDAQLYADTYGQNPLWIDEKIVGCLQWLTGLSSYAMTLKEGAEMTSMNPPVWEGEDNNGTLLRPNGLFGIPSSVDGNTLTETVQFAQFLISDPMVGKCLGMSCGVPPVEAQKQAGVEAGVLGDNAVRGIRMAQEDMGMVVNEASNNSEVTDIIKDCTARVCYGEDTPAAGAQRCIEQLTRKLEQLKGQ